ncbi:MAG: type VI secretion system baseplate subunit TssK [Pirellulales bacterium]|nr:type VI secretion system baseplate subunit TssK [Pirellulales bacterium]
MRNPSVHWKEGLFLRPHHLQAADRHWGERVSVGEQLNQAYHYGFASIRISEEALANHQIAISNCLARMKDGAVVSFDAAQEYRFDLREGLRGEQDLESLFIDHEVLRVYLAVPQLNLGAPNVGSAGLTNKCRFVQVLRSDTPDESIGGNPQDIDHRDWNLQILLSTDDLAGYEVLPICQIKRSADSDGLPVIDPDYFPPVLAIDAWPGLALGIVREIYDMIGKRSEALRREIADRRITFASREPGDLERLWMLSVLNEAIGKLSCDSFAAGVHPYDSYRSLCEIVGQLSILGPNKKVGDIPHYDHDNLARIFQWAKREIDALIHALKRDEVEQRYFIGVGKGLQVKLDKQWFEPDWKWYVGVDPINITSDECMQLLTSGTIDWKLGSSDRVEFIYKERAHGVELQPLVQIPSALASFRGNWIFFKISQDTPEWKHVQLSNDLAIRMNERLIKNLDKLRGEKRIIFAKEGKLIGLEFSVFAVRQRT